MNSKALTDAVKLFLIILSGMDSNYIVTSSNPIYSSKNWPLPPEEALDFEILSTESDASQFNFRISFGSDDSAEDLIYTALKDIHMFGTCGYMFEFETVGIEFAAGVRYTTIGTCPAGIELRYLSEKDGEGEKELEEVAMLLRTYVRQIYSVIMA